jgi:hypothetical protein
MTNKEQLEAACKANGFHVPVLRPRSGGTESECLRCGLVRPITRKTRIVLRYPKEQTA